MKYIKIFYSLFVMSCLCGHPPIHATDYYVFRFSGLLLQHKNDKWVVPKERDSVVLRDQFKLEEGANLAIADRKNGRVYYTNKSGVQNVAQIISAARRQSDDISMLTLQQALASMKKDGTRKYPVLGVVNRGGNLQIDTTFIIYSQLCHNIKLQHINGEDSIVSLSYVHQGDIWFFHANNNSPDYLYINIVQVPSDKSAILKASLCLDFGSSNETPFIIIPPYSEMDLSQFHFADFPKKDCLYYLFASEYPFDSQSLKILLENGETPIENDCKINLYFSKLKP